MVAAFVRDVFLIELAHSLIRCIAHRDVELFLELSDIKTDELFFLRHFLTGLYRVVNQVADHHTQVYVCHCCFLRNCCFVINRDAIVDGQ